MLAECEYNETEDLCVMKALYVATAATKPVIKEDNNDLPYVRNHTERESAAAVAWAERQYGWRRRIEVMNVNANCDESAVVHKAYSADEYFVNRWLGSYQITNRPPGRSAIPQQNERDDGTDFREFYPAQETLRCCVTGESNQAEHV